MIRNVSLSAVLVLLTFLYTVAQKPYVQVQASGGYSMPLMNMQDEYNFCDPGWNANLGFGMFFGKFGLMARGGYQRHASSSAFQNFVNNKYKENFKGASGQNWTNAYGMVGPVFKFSFGRFDLDFFAQVGMANIIVPDLVYSKLFLGQQTEIAKFYGKNDELTPLWTGGLTLHARVLKDLRIFVEPSFLSIGALEKKETTFRYVNAQDINQNGFIDDVEFTEAEIIRSTNDVIFSNFSINLGLSYQFGRTIKTIEPEPMITLEEAMEQQPEKPKDITTPVDTPNSGPEGQMQGQSGLKFGMVGESNLPVETSKTVSLTYDEAEAKFLFKAGELYFQTNDFENALACFNKLKNDPNHLMAKYMFSLSLCEMANCEEALKEYLEFEKQYKDDVGVLYTVFKSHHEKCRKTMAELQASRDRIKRELAASEDQKTTSEPTPNQKSGKPSNENINKTDSGNKDVHFKIQFVALRVSNKSFPRMESIGTISNEYFPNKSMYRYILGPYSSEDEAVSDMLKVRAMGFDDAFLAEYKNGVRTNTLHHAR